MDEGGVVAVYYTLVSRNPLTQLGLLLSVVVFD